MVQVSPFTVPEALDEHSFVPPVGAAPEQFTVVPESMVPVVVPVVVVPVVVAVVVVPVVVAVVVVPVVVAVVVVPVVVAVVVVPVVVVPVVVAVVVPVVVLVVDVASVPPSSNPSGLPDEDEQAAIVPATIAAMSAFAVARICRSSWGRPQVGGADSRRIDNGTDGPIPFIDWATFGSLAFHASRGGVSA
jgi:signal-induced proliferation-associated 1 like protein 3